MRAPVLGIVAILALLASAPGPAAATSNFWPRSASTSTHLGWGVWGAATSLDAVSDGANGFFIAHDDGYGGHVQHVLANGSTAWPWYVYEPPGATNGYGNPAIALDGTGGVLVAYETHGGGDDLRVVRVTAGGTLAPDWPAGGLPVCASADYDYLADITDDGEGGAYVAFIRTGPYRVYVQHVLASGKPDSNWPADGVAVQEAGECFAAPQVAPDGEGGVMVFYVGTPYGGMNLLVSRVGPDGSKRTDLFPASGLALSGGTSSRFSMVRTGDGLFGVTWSDARTGANEVYLDVLDSAGRMPFAPPGGLRLSNGAGSHTWPALATNANRDFLVAWVAGSQVMGARRQQDLSTHPAFPAGSAVLASTASPYVHHPSVASDGGEGMVVSWRDPNDPAVLRVQRMTGGGTVPAGWGPGGQVLATSSGYIGDYSYVFGDGEGGACAVFSDYGALAINRVRRDGSHGLLVPAVFSALLDVPVDQGGKLSVYWRASEVDTTPANPVGSYLLWRRMPALAAQARLAEGSRTLAAHESPVAAGAGAIRVRADATTTTYWEYLGATPARGWPGYGMTVQTQSDAVFVWSYLPHEVFVVETVAPNGSVLATSAPDSGYSVDNLSPVPPAAFSAALSGGVTLLSWQPNGEPDLHSYCLYRGTSAAFVPSAANLVATLSVPGYADAAAGYFYKLAATDVHGNTSAFALVSPAQTLDVPGAAGAGLALAPVAPNPAREAVTLAFTLPGAAHVRLAVYDAQGRLARALADGPLGAGPHSRTWDLRGSDGRPLAPGLYLARLTTPAGTRVRRFAVVE